MQSRIRCVGVARPLAAAAALFLLASHTPAFSQVVDPGWQLVYAEQPGFGNEGLIGLFGDGTGLPVVARAYQPASSYYGPQQAAVDPPAPVGHPQAAASPPRHPYQPAAQARAYPAAPAAQPQVVAPQQRAYQPTLVYVPQGSVPRGYAPQGYAPQPRGYQPAPVYYQQVPAQPAVQVQTAVPAQAAAPRQPMSVPARGPQYTGSVAAQPVAGVQAVPRSGMAAQPQPAHGPQYTGSAAAQPYRGLQPTPQYAMAAPQQQQPAYQTAQPAPQQRPTFGYQNVAAPPQQTAHQTAQPAPAAQQPVYQVAQPAPAPQQRLAFGYQNQPQAYGYQPQPQQEYGYQTQPQPYGYGQPAYTPSSYGNMAQQPMDPRYERQLVDYAGSEEPGTVVIDTPHFFLYLVLGGGKAVRYGIGVGRPGFTWSGVKEISAKREWPDWRPPDEMLVRRPDLPRYMPGGPDNPLGARALYLGSTLYRIHGSNEPWSIGTQVSSGCIRLRNEDIIDLYGRVKVGTKVVVI